MDTISVDARNIVNGKRRQLFGGRLERLDARRVSSDVQESRARNDRRLSCYTMSRAVGLRVGPLMNQGCNAVGSAAQGTRIEDRLHYHWYTVHAAPVVRPVGLANVRGNATYAIVATVK